MSRFKNIFLSMLADYKVTELYRLNQERQAILKAIESSSIKDKLAYLNTHSSCPKKLPLVRSVRRRLHLIK
ncbi:hypothetical protein A0256_23220 [Mucilaginibacter sp. PAMC 26640]|nr:hypothetical protein A0256_23220 [Mucilaginibacter sp. PAMC 26640]